MIALGLLCLSAACHAESPTEPRRLLVPGIIEGWGGVPVLDVVSDGNVVTIRTVTYGMDGCWWKGALQVSTDTERHIVTAEPRDWSLDPLGVCFDVLATFHHEATVELGEGGTWTIIVKGEKLVGANTRTERSISQTIEVS